MKMIYLNLKGKSNLLKKAIMRIPTVQINHRELYAVW